ncbi:unnamed protein product [Moneuplotes crassus]|uniref:Tetratricopeptide repeat protein n=1 Tax=Euplotes crassus TaxID=5936 RepID=A0AAD2D273_EUPCR|nr:unnamed protein product [Moneuplotes crassus]
MEYSSLNELKQQVNELEAIATQAYQNKENQENEKEAEHYSKIMDPVISDSFTELCKRACMICSFLSDNFTKISWLEKALEICDKDEEAKSLALINISNYYSKIGQFKSAAQYLEKSLKIDIRLNKNSTRAETHLSLCTMYSQMGKHESAKRQATNGIIFLQLKIKNAFVPKFDEERRRAAEKDLKLACLTFKDDIAVLALCYHNLAIEQEFLSEFDDSIKSFLKAKLTAEDYLGDENPLTRHLSQVYTKAKTNLEAHIAKTASSGSQKSQIFNH